MIRFLAVLFLMFSAAVSASAQIKIEQVTSEGGIQNEGGCEIWQGGAFWLGAKMAHGLLPPTLPAVTTMKVISS